ncbi:MAG TPA: hypothetical protein VN214_11820, partial [Pseudomonas sp.]|nr:hypothetical protein [Pseudomonas sp.]
YTDRMVVREQTTSKNVMSLWFFCHVQMVTFARSSVLLRPDVALNWSFTEKTVVPACAKAGGEEWLANPTNNWGIHNDHEYCG